MDVNEAGAYAQDLASAPLEIPVATVESSQRSCLGKRRKGQGRKPRACKHTVHALAVQ